MKVVVGHLWVAPFFLWLILASSSQRSIKLESKISSCFLYWYVYDVFGDLQIPLFRTKDSIFELWEVIEKTLEFHEMESLMVLNCCFYNNVLRLAKNEGEIGGKNLCSLLPKLRGLLREWFQHDIRFLVSTLMSNCRICFWAFMCLSSCT